MLLPSPAPRRPAMLAAAGLFVAALTPGAKAATRSSAAYTAPAETFDAGGVPSASTAYLQSAGSIGLFGGVQTSPAYTSAAGFLGDTAEPGDTTPPVITTPGNLTATASSAAGAAVTFSVSASDAVSGAVAATASPASGSTFPIGTTPVNVSATDAAGNTGTASFMVTVTATPAQNWRQQYYGTMENTGDAADTADPDGDGLNNLQERAFGTNPKVSQSGVVSVNSGVVTPGSPATVMTSTQFGVDFRAVFSRRKDYTAAELTYAVQFSADLSAWVTSTATPAVLADDGTLQAVTVPSPLSIAGEKPRFFRVTVTQQ